MALKFLGLVTVTAGAPQLLTSVAAIVAAGRGKSFAAIIIAPRRTNTGFVYVGDFVTTNEATACFTIPPPTAVLTPYVTVPPNAVRQNPMGIEGISIDGSVNGDIVHISGIEL